MTNVRTPESPVLVPAHAYAIPAMTALLLEQVAAEIADDFA